jgi:hypothetical protein
VRFKTLSKNAYTKYTQKWLGNYRTTKEKTQRVKIAKRPLVRHNAPPQRFLGMTHNGLQLLAGRESNL